MKCLRCNGAGDTCCKYTGLQRGYYDDLSIAIVSANNRPKEWAGKAAVYELGGRFAVVVIGTPLFTEPKYGKQVYLA